MSVPAPAVHRRGAVLPAMLLVSLSLLLLAAGTLHLIRADIASLGAMEGIEQSRMIIRSGVRAFGIELSRQRGGMFRGLTPEVPQRLELFQLDGQVAVAWLLPLGPAGETLVPEAGKLDLNTATSEMLVGMGLLDPVEADAIVTARGSRPGGRFQSVHELMAIEGETNIDEVRLYGDLEELRILSLVDQNEESIGERIGDRLARELGGDARGLLDVLTVHSFEPDVRSDGQPRLLLGGDAVEVDLEFRDNETALVVTKILESMEGKTFSSEGRELLPVLDFSAEVSWRGSPDLSQRSEALDSVTIYSGGWRNGRVDINTAPREVLQALPGLDAETVAAIIDMRESLAEEERFDRLWPVTRGVLEAEAWAETLDFVTTRSLLWRARIVAGTIAADDPEEVLQSPLVWEVLYDCSVDPPRLVEVRDVTMLELVARMLGAGTSFELSASAEANEEVAGVDEASLFDEEPLFEDDPLFNDDDPLFNDDEPLFNDDEPLFNESLIFNEEPLFGDPPEAPALQEPRESAPEEAKGLKQDGPAGRWSPAGSQR